MALANGAATMLLPLILLMIIFMTTIGLCECDYSLPLVEVGHADCARWTDHGCEFHDEYSNTLELELMRQGDFESSSKRTTSCGMMVYEESDESNSTTTSIPEIEIEATVTQVRMMSLDVSDAPGSFPAELLVPVIIFAIFICFGVSFVTYIIIPLIIIMFLFSLFSM